MRYIPSSEADRKALLKAIGIESVEELFKGIPEKIRLKRPLDIPAALTEPELLRFFQNTAERNATGFTSFLGAGVYRHHIPIVIDALISRSEFYTAYTPYQAEIAQGTLQAILEFQTYMTQLTGLEVANASLYDGSTGLAESVLMAHRITRRNKLLIAKSVHPEYRAIVNTYTRNLGIEVQFIDYMESGKVDIGAIEKAIDTTVAAVVIQSPNFFGTIEDNAEIGAIAHQNGALSIVSVCEAMSLGILKPPQDADIVVGEGQSLGVPVSFGGPHVGFLATRNEFVRQIPGRLVGMGEDHDGKRAFVLTLSTREQHIRREKATSNICTNQSLCALMCTIYLATMGPAGLRQTAEQNIQKTHYAVQRIRARTRHAIRFTGPAFNEFVITLKDDFATRAQRLLRNRIIPGVNLAKFYPDLPNALLICVTETTSREQIDSLVKGLE